MEDGNITCDDNDNNNDDNNDNITTNEEDEQQQQQHEGTVNGPPQLESSVVRTDFNMPNTEAVDIIRNGDFNYPVYRLPRVEGQPIGLFTDAKAEEMAFPCLFPNGVNGFLTARDPAISITDYIQIRLLNADSRWASHIPYLLWSCNLLEQHRLRDAVCIAMRIRSSSGGRRPRNHPQRTLTCLRIVLVSCVIFAAQLHIGKGQSLMNLRCFVHLDLQLSSSHSVLMI